VKAFPHRPALDLKQRYPASKEEALDLLSKMLNFNPFFRPSVQECLDHPYLRCVKSAQLEQMAQKEVSLEVDGL
jgi:serine/threonine protein kinase